MMLRNVQFNGSVRFWFSEVNIAEEHHSFLKRFVIFQSLLQSQYTLQSKLNANALCLNNCVLNKWKHYEETRRIKVPLISSFHFVRVLIPQTVDID